MKKLAPIKRKPRPNPRLVCVGDGKPQQTYYTFNSLPSRYKGDELQASEMAGDSLTNAGIPRGYMMAIVHGRAVSSGDLVAVKLHDEPDGLTVRYVFFGPGGWIRLQTADRDEYPDLIYTPGEFEIVGPVVHAEPNLPQLRQD